MAQDNTTINQIEVSKAVGKRALVWLIAALCAAIATFALFPQLDVQTSAVFGSQATGFPLRGNPFWEGVRQFFIYATNGPILVLLICWLVLRIRPSLIKGGVGFRRVAGFSALAYLLIPGVVVNGLIKPLWGRARPYNTVEFGGSLNFTSPFEVAGQCSHACSFVSGEASALFTCATLAFLFIVPLFAKKVQLPVAALIFGLAVAGSALRIVVGAHFLSDVVIASLLSSAIVFALALRFPEAAPPKGKA